jgi:hypothetical protein
MDRTPKVLQAAARDAAVRARLLADALDALADAADALSQVPVPAPAGGVGGTAVESGSERLWAVADVAKFLGASESWVRNASASGRLPRLRIGGLLRFDPDRIRAHVRGEGSPRLRVKALLRRPRTR